MNLSELSDEQLIEAYREGDLSAAEVILERFEPMLHGKASTLFILGGEEQDLIQEGRIGIAKAINDYDFGRDASFATFANLCADRQMYNAIKASGRLKNMPLNEAISLAAGRIFDDGDTAGMPVEDLVGNPKHEPEGHIISKERVDEINRLIETILTKSEKEVFQLHLTGLPTSRIAAILGINPKSADNSLQRAKSKLRKAITDNL